MYRNNDYWSTPNYGPYYLYDHYYMFRQQVTAQQVMQRLRTQHNNLYSQLQRSGMDRQLVDYIFSFVVNFTLNQANPNQTAAQVYQQFQTQVPWFNIFFTQANVPLSLANRVLTNVIEIVLSMIRPGQPGQPGQGWSGWESLGGVLTSAPSASSWQNNRLDVFARGTDNALYHIWWDGRAWSNWEDLGGTLTSAPTVSSRRPNHLEVFARGTGDQLFRREWNGSRWTPWENLGGRITSAPAAVSWGPIRTDVFARGQNQDLVHLWRGQ